MPKSIEAADRRPLVYGVFVLMILVAASYLFWPRSPKPESLVLTPESVRTESAAADLTTDMPAEITEGETVEDLADLDAIQVDAPLHIAAETSISEQPPTTTVKSTPKQAAPARTQPAASQPAANTEGSMPAATGKWVLNVGAYSTESSAKARAAEISREGMSAHVHRVESNGKTLWRVRVGYFGTKAKAAEYAQWMKSTHGIDGWTGAR